MGFFVPLLQPLVCMPRDSCPYWTCHCLSVNDNLPELSAESQSCSSQSRTSVFANSRAGRGGRGQETPHRWGTSPGPASAWAGRRWGEPELEALSLSAKETSRDIGNMQLDTCVREKGNLRGRKCFLPLRLYSMCGPVALTRCQARPGVHPAETLRCVRVMGRNSVHCKCLCTSQKSGNNLNAINKGLIK